LPKNPRTGKTSGDEQLRKSIIDSPEMLEFRSLVVYPFEDGYVTIMGNRRLKICKETEYKEIGSIAFREKYKEYKLY
jgi:hypothetical protein